MPKDGQEQSTRSFEKPSRFFRKLKEHKHADSLVLTSPRFFSSRAATCNSKFFEVKPLVSNLDYGDKFVKSNRA